MKLSNDQRLTLTSILSWFREEKKDQLFITLGGYAGTGKTTLITTIRNRIAKIDKKIKVGFASYTGKATRVLRTKLREQKAIFSQDTVGTIHSLIYSPIVNEREEIIGWKQKEKIDRNLIIIDEASMVDQIIWKHLTSYNVPIIVVGDHGQLPPIMGNFNLVKSPQLILEEIHRQARLNPIIGLSIQARVHGQIKPGHYSDTVIKFDMTNPETNEKMESLLANYDQSTLILCGYNTTRVRLNNHIRDKLGFDSHTPSCGDRVICLRNNHTKNIFNGMQGTLVDIELVDDDWYKAEITMDNELVNYNGLISSKQFGSTKPLNFTEKRSTIMKGDLFDFGYAITVHKAQGSQAKKVILFEERFSKMSLEDWRRWLYTAVTRAEEELYIFS